ncbi:MAG: NosD domain-containing protein [Promethearchaeota archaeon]
MPKILGQSIHIDNNLTAAKNQGICTGNGTYSNPYIIKNLIIEGGGTIVVENSVEYFIIENCSILNAYPKPGITLNYVHNAKLIKNNSSFHYYGIRVEFSSNITISGNNLDSNIKNILISRSNNITISRNSANNNLFIGISISGSQHIIVSENNVSYGDSGIYLSFSSYCTVSRNDADCNSYYGIKLENSASNNVLENILYFNSIGIHIQGSSKNNISGNMMGGCGIFLLGGLFNYIDTTNLVNGRYVYFYRYEFHLTSKNFTNAGQIILDDCSSVKISNINVSYSSYGVLLWYCSNITIFNTTSNNNERGIYAIGIDDSNISRCVLNDNNEAGIWFGYCDNTIISQNVINRNTGYRILLKESYYNTIKYNILYGNDVCIREEDCVGNKFAYNK